MTLSESKKLLGAFKSLHMTLFCQVWCDTILSKKTKSRVPIFFVDFGGACLGGVNGGGGVGGAGGVH